MCQFFLTYCKKHFFLVLWVISNKKKSFSVRLLRYLSFQFRKNAKYVQSKMFFGSKRFLEYLVLSAFTLIQFVGTWSVQDIRSIRRGHHSSDASIRLQQVSCLGPGFRIRVQRSFLMRLNALLIFLFLLWYHLRDSSLHQGYILFLVTMLFCWPSCSC